MKCYFANFVFLQDINIINKKAPINEALFFKVYCLQVPFYNMWYVLLTNLHS
ncbi:hypothetical protein D7V67_04100 [Clostridium paraputrificum]|nr:hypothetical protein D7V67_04100 [Clostridium paraputrificum]